MTAEAGLALAAAFGVSVALVPLLVSFAIGRNLLDVPNARSSHEVPTPRLGGVAVILGAWAAAPFAGSIPLLVAATFAGAVGLLDDFVDLPFWLKAVGQAVVAFCLLFLIPPPLLAAAGPFWPLALLFGVTWVTAVVNAYNFMDGIDGIVGGTVILNAFFLAPLLVGSPGVAAGLVPLGAAVAGFLVWNLSPARIFLGDGGSHFIGLYLGSLALYTDPVAGNALLAFVVAAAVFAPFLFDTAFTLVRRAAAGKNVFSAHREHVYQRITPDPARHRQGSIVYFFLAAVSGAAALVASGGTPGRLLLGGGLVLAVCASIAALPLLSSRITRNGR